MKELDAEARQHGASMQEISAAHKDLLRNLVDQQLWLSKGKELGINGETDLVKRLDEIRKQYNLETLRTWRRRPSNRAFRTRISSQYSQRHHHPAGDAPGGGQEDSVYPRRGGALL